MTRDELIEKVRQLIDDEVLTRTGRSVGDLASGHVARALADANLLADPEQQQAELEKYRQYDASATRLRLQVERILDVALGTEEEDGAGYGLAGDVALLAEREKAARVEAGKLRAQLARVAAVLARPWPDDEDHHDFVNRQVEDARAALQSGQPAEPEARCMNGPAKQHTLRMGEIIKALREASVAGVLPDHLDERSSFAPLARAIVDHWPACEVAS